MWSEGQTILLTQVHINEEYLRAAFVGFQLPCMYMYINFVVINRSTLNMEGNLHLMCEYVTFLCFKTSPVDYFRCPISLFYDGK